MIGSYPGTGMPAGPLGCGGAIVVLLVVLLAIAVFIAGVWWGFRDLGLQ